MSRTKMGDHTTVNRSVATEQSSLRMIFFCFVQNAYLECPQYDISYWEYCMPQLSKYTVIDVQRLELGPQYIEKYHYLPRSAPILLLDIFGIFGDIPSSKPYSTSASSG